MKRRDFLTAAAVAGVTAATVTTTEAQARRRHAAQSRQYIELRTYRVKNAEKKKTLLETLDKALVPALRRQGIGPVGVFSWHEGMPNNDKAYENTVFVLMQHANQYSFTGLADRLLADKTFVKDGATVLGVPLAESVYETYESTLLYGFKGCPAIERPVTSENRVFQLRYYKSYNIDRNAWKIHMFGEGGELGLFREVGMHPIFFGDTLFGQMMPNLTYMLGFENPEAQKAAWDVFRKHPTWQKIKDAPLYKETATTIVNVFMKPSAGSQI